MYIFNLPDLYFRGILACANEPVSTSVFVTCAFFWTYFFVCFFFYFDVFVFGYIISII